MPLTLDIRPLKRPFKHPSPSFFFVFIAGLGLVSCGGSAGGPSTGRSISNPLKILSSSVVEATVGESFEVTLAASGGTAPYWWDVNKGYLPLGLVLDQATGKISGVPTQTGEFSFTAIVKDAAPIQQQEASQTMILSVNIPSLSIATPWLPGGTLGAPYVLQLQATGGIPPYTWSITSGALAPGLELNPLTGLISGTPQEEGTFTVTIQVRDSDTPPSYALIRIGAPGEKSPPALTLLNGISSALPGAENLASR